MSDFTGFPETTFRFLDTLSRQNDKETFLLHRADYDAGYVEPARAFVEAIGPRLKKISRTVQFDPKIDGSIMRINRDLRFSKDKSPYKTHLDLWFWHGEERGWEMPGFFLRMFPDRVIIGGGTHQFTKPRLEKYRQKVLAPRSGRALAAALDDLRKYSIGGMTRKRVPPGLDPDHERADLLKHGGLWAEIEIKPVKGRRFVDTCADHFAAVAPVVRWLL